MLTIIILLILFIGSYSGYKTGGLLQLVKAIGYGISFIFALKYYEKLSSYLELIIPYPSPYVPGVNPYSFYSKDLLFSLDQSYYYIISVLLIFLIGWFIVQIITRILSYTIEDLVFPEPANGVIGAVIGFLIKYLGIFLILFLLTTVPIDFIQNKMSENFLISKIIESTPLISNKSYQSFIIDVHQEVEATSPLMDITDPTEESSSEENLSEEEKEKNEE